MIKTLPIFPNLKFRPENLTSPQSNNGHRAQAHSDWVSSWAQEISHFQLEKKKEKEKVEQERIKETNMQGQDEPIHIPIYVNND